MCTIAILVDASRVVPVDAQSFLNADGREKSSETNTKSTEQ